MPQTQFFEDTLTLSSLSKPARLDFPVKLAYRTFGTPSNPAVLLPTCYNGTLETTLPFLYSKNSSPDPLFSPSKYFIVVTALLGGGESSSPSNSLPPHQGPDFPKVTYEDNIRLQYKLCLSLGVKKLFAYIGFSMGGQQAYHMSILYPDFVENMVCLAGSAQTSWHNWNVLEGLKHALIYSSDFQDGKYTEPPKQGLKAFDSVFSSWALSPSWFRQRVWQERGFESLEQYLEADWAGSGDANDLLAMLWTWQHGDITLYHPDDRGEIGKTLRRIEAKCLLLPSRTDQFFQPEDNEAEVMHLKQGVFRCIESIHGHLAGGGDGSREDTDFIIEEIRRFLFRGS